MEIIIYQMTQLVIASSTLVADDDIVVRFWLGFFAEYAHDVAVGHGEFGEFFDGGPGWSVVQKLDEASLTREINLHDRAKVILAILVLEKNVFAVWKTQALLPRSAVRDSGTVLWF